MKYLPLQPVDYNGVSVPDPLAYYKISDIDDLYDPQYYGFQAHDGGWYILKVNVTDKSYRYAAGRGDYPVAWANRSSLGYDYFDAIF